MAEIVFEQVSKSFGNTKVIENLNLTIRDGAFTVLLGPSGCGKTTLLRMIAGIGPATSGTIYMDGEDISACLLYTSEKEICCGDEWNWIKPAGKAG